MNRRDSSATLQHWSWCISTKQEGATRAHPDNWEMKAKKFFRASRGLIATTCLYAAAFCSLPPLLLTSSAAFVLTAHLFQSNAVFHAGEVREGIDSSPPGRLRFFLLSWGRLLSRPSSLFTSIPRFSAASFSTWLTTLSIGDPIFPCHGRAIHDFTIWKIF